MIKLVLDSNCDLTMEFCQKHDIEMIPLSVAFGQKGYTENVDMTKKEFYEMMETSEELPKTSQPSPQQYFDVFEKLAKEGHQMIVLTVTSALSGCYQSAMIAKQMCEDAVIEIIDTKNAAIGVQIQALEILKMIQKGEIFENILVKAKENVEKTRLYATIDTVNYSTTSYRASCFTHHRLMISEDIDKSYTVSTSVRFGLFHPYHNYVYRRFMLLPSVCAELLF